MADGSFQQARPQRIWSEDELSILRENYPTKGGKHCARLLPGKSWQQVVSKARRLDLVSGYVKGERSRIYQTTPEIDAAIRDFYSRPVVKGSFVEFSQQLKRPTWWIKRRAGHLEVVVTRRRELPWSDAEIEILENFAGMGLRTIQVRLRRAGFARTEQAISIKRHRIGIVSADEHALNGYYSVAMITRTLGVQHQTALRWIKVEGLPARRRDPGRADEAGEWEISSKALRSFLASNQHLIDFRKIDRDLFLDLVLGDLA